MGGCWITPDACEEFRYKGEEWAASCRGGWQSRGQGRDTMPVGSSGGKWHGEVESDGVGRDLEPSWTCGFTSVFQINRRKGGMDVSEFVSTVFGISSHYR